MMIMELTDNGRHTWVHRCAARTENSLRGESVRRGPGSILASEGLVGS
jgi:hypothetical protein